MVCGGGGAYLMLLYARSLLFGGSAPNSVITLNGHTVDYVSGGLLPAQTAYQLSMDGIVRTGTGSYSFSYTTNENWDSNPGTVTNYEAYVTKTSGALLTSGTLNSWIALGSADQTWTLNSSAGNYKSSVIQVQIRDKNTLVVKATASITLTSDAL